MATSSGVLEYKCPCCGASLVFSESSQKMACKYCANEYEIDVIRQYYDRPNQADATEFIWNTDLPSQWSDEEKAHLQVFLCPSCGGELITDETTAATFCPYCANPAIVSSRFSGGLRPDGVIPFKISKDQAKEAFIKYFKKMPLIPEVFRDEKHLNKLSGVYIPFWLYDCSGNIAAKYNAKRIKHWSDAKLNYSQIDHYLLIRDADTVFNGIPMDASSKTNDTVMEAIEPFDYSELVSFDPAYLSGFMADKFDIPSSAGEERILTRARKSVQESLYESLNKFSDVTPLSQKITVNHIKTRYILVPVWILNVPFANSTYTLHMNGQTGAITGKIPSSTKRANSIIWKIMFRVALVLTAFDFIRLLLSKMGELL